MQLTESPSKAIVPLGIKQHEYESRKVLLFPYFSLLFFSFDLKIERN
ncbi:hypothetical protein HMPREF1869_01770 [Bacteroidales bacterium KA00251]|nr:hypothetical protein HMPREF1869_01770 [Bacteroidales bacterium KA00251]